MRDLQKDLEICDRATSGPWLMAEEPEVILENTFSQPVILSAVCFYDDLGASKVEAIQANDLEFIIQAREGWPHAIERAIKAEKALGNETILNGKALAKLNERADKAETLARELVEALKKAHEYIGDINSFYGQGLQVHGWHFNGAFEPLDNFIDSNGGCETEEFVGRVLTKVKEVLGDE